MESLLYIRAARNEFNKCTTKNRHNKEMGSFWAHWAKIKIRSSKHLYLEFIFVKGAVAYKRQPLQKPA